MGRKKKHKQQKKTKFLQEIGKSPVPIPAGQQMVPPKGKGKKGITLKQITIIGSVLMVILILYFFLIDRDFFANDPSSKSIERIPFPAPKPSLKDEEVKFENFLGSEACASCHTEIYKMWEKSTHGQAGGSPNSIKIIGKFDGRERNFQDAAVTPYIDSDGNYMFRLQVDGLPDQTFKVEAVIGGGHMIGGGTQTYFTKFPDGTIRLIPFDFHRGEQ